MGINRRYQNILEICMKQKHFLKASPFKDFKQTTSRTAEGYICLLKGLSFFF